MFIGHLKHRLRVGACLLGFVAMPVGHVMFFAAPARAATAAAIRAADPCTEDGDSGECDNNSSTPAPAPSGGGCCGGSTHTPTPAPQDNPAPQDIPAPPDATPAPQSPPAPPAAAPQETPAQPAAVPGGRSRTPSVPAGSPAPEVDFLPAAAPAAAVAPASGPTVQLAAGPTPDAEATTGAQPIGSSDGGDDRGRLGGIIIMAIGAVGAASTFRKGQQPAAVSAESGSAAPAPTPPVATPSAPFTSDEQAYLNAKSVADQRFHDLPNTRDPNFKAAYDQYLDAQNEANRLGEGLRSSGNRPPEQLP